jgi:predicted porin
MRNYLLASAAMLGLVAAGTAQAATFAPTDPVKHSSAFGAPATNPDPGKIIVHMGGLVAIDATAGSADTSKGANGAKNSDYGLSGYFRLYFGFDGKLTNGMIYGAKAEMRTNFASVIRNSSANSAQSTWYTRRAYGYVGGTSWGIVRIGQGDGPNSLFNGISTGEAYDTGQWDGDICTFYGASCIAWAFLDVGNEYVSNKITWISPSWSGFQLGLSYAPESVGLFANGNGTAASGGNPAQSTSPFAVDMSRPKDMFEVAARYQGNLGPVAVDAKLGYLGSTTVKGTAAANTALNALGASGYKGLNVIDGGLALTYMGASLFGHISTGKMDGAATPQWTVPTGSPRSNKDGIAWTVGAQYSNGPYTVGTSWYEFDHMGSMSGTGFRKDRGFGIGGNYNIVPGFDLFLSYLWGEIKQSNINFVDGGTGPNHNKIDTSAVQATALFRW